MQFRAHRVVGDIVELARRYSSEGADELVFYDITASPDRRTVDRSWIGQVSATIDIPFCVAGGIRSVADAEAVLRHGADKISINSPALARPALIDELAARFGSQCVVVGIDSRAGDDGWQVWQHTGSTATARTAGRRTLDWAREAAERGAGEIVLNCMNRDGVRRGYDIEQLQALRAQSSIPLVASGGAGSPEHFIEVFDRSDVDAALAASVFHSGEIRIPDLKRRLIAAGIDIRP